MFDQYKHNKLAVIIHQDNDELLSDLRKDGWFITKYDDFINNLPLWVNGTVSDKVIVESMFSEQIPGIKQHVLNKIEQYVGIMGKKNANISNLIMEEYHRRNYNVLLIDDKNNIKYFKTPYNRVYLEMNNGKNTRTR